MISLPTIYNLVCTVTLCLREWKWMATLYLNAALVATLPFEFLSTHLQNPLGQDKKALSLCGKVFPGSGKT